MPELVAVHISPPHAVCTLSLPKKRNPISAEMRASLTAALDKLLLEPDVRAVIITGAGSAFCSGMDLECLSIHAQLSLKEHRADSEHLRRFFAYIYSYPKPTIAAVNGPAVAGGCGLAALCDFTLASSAAWFSLSEVKIGFIPAIVGAYLERIIGPKRARDLLLSGRKVSAEEAQSIGLINEVTPAARLMPRAVELALELSANGPEALKATKNLLVQFTGLSCEEALNLAVDINAKARTSAECKEGVKAFLEKREPSWRSWR